MKLLETYNWRLFFNISEKLNIDHVSTYLVRDNSANAFVINNNIYFTTGLLKLINNEDTLKAIYLHEYGHIIKKHFYQKNRNSTIKS